MRPNGQEARLIQKLLSLVLLTGTIALAQYGGNHDGRRNPDATGQRTIDSIQADLVQIGQRAAWDRWAQRQLRDAINNLERFQRSTARGRFDRDRLDNAIDNLNRLLTAPRCIRATGSGSHTIVTSCGCFAPAEEVNGNEGESWA